MSRRLPLFDGGADEGQLPVVAEEARIALPSPSVLLFAVDPHYDPESHLSALVEGFAGRAGFITARAGPASRPPERTIAEGEAPFSPAGVVFSARLSAFSERLPDQVAELVEQLPGGVPIVGWGAALVACTTADVVVMLDSVRHASRDAARARVLASAADLVLPSGRPSALGALATRLASRP